MTYAPLLITWLVCCIAFAFGQSPTTGFSIQLPASAIIEPGSAADVGALMERFSGTGRPAGIHGFLKTAQERFEFQDGQAIRFWGFNWPSDQPLPVGDNAISVAQRLVQQGFNTVRLPLPVAGDAKARDNFDQFTSCLRNQGIYLDLLLPGGIDPGAYSNRFTRLAPRDDTGVALMEVVGLPQAAADLRRREPRVPVTAAGPVQTTGDLVARQALDFLSQTVVWERSEPMVKNAQTIFGPMSFGAPVNRPLFIGAWSAVASNPFRIELPLWITAIAGFQGWAGVCAAPDLRVASPAAPMDAVTWAWAPACALMFQRNDVTPAKSKMLFRLDPSAPAKGGDDAVTAIVNVGMTRFFCEATLTNMLGWLVLGSGTVPGLATINPRISDTGEIVHDWQIGQVKIDTPRTQAIIGFFGRQPVETRDLRLTLTDGTFAAVALTSLDGEPLSKSQRVLLTATGRADPSGKPLLEPVTGEVTLRSLAPSQRDRKIFALDLTGRRLGEVPLADRGFQLQPKLNVAWYEIIAESLLSKPAAQPSPQSPGAADAKKKTE